MITQDRLIDPGMRLSLICLLLGLYMLVYIPNINSADGEAILAVTASMVRHGVPDIGVYGASDALFPFDMSRMGAFGVDGAYYSKKGVTPSIALVPLVLLARLLPTLDTRAVAMLFNPLVTTATALCIYTLARWLSYKPRTAFVLALLYGAATIALPYVKTLYGEPLAGLLLIGAVMFVYCYRQEGDLIPLVAAGLCVGLMVGINMVYLAVIPVLALYAVGGRRLSSALLRHLLAYSAPIIGILLLIGIYNWARFGSPLNTGYHFEAGEGFTSPMLEGVYGLTIGAYRGLFWYSPLLLLAIPGWLMLRHRTSRLAWLILTLTILQILAFAAWWSWHGGIVWGPRFLLPVTPLLAFCLAPLIEAAWKKKGIAAALVGFAALSLAVQLLGTLYSLYPYIGYLYQHYYDSNLSELMPEVRTNPGLSAIIGHVALVLAGWQPELSWATPTVDIVHLLAALGLSALGILLLWARLSVKRYAALVTLVVAVSLYIVAAQQGHRPVASTVRELERALQPADMVVAATTEFGESLVDIDNGSWVVSTNAPTAPDDRLATAMWDFATASGWDNVWLLTWFSPADPMNWQERDLWAHGAFAYERQVAGHRALLFNLSPALRLDREAGYRFDRIRLERYGVTRTSDGLLVMVEWSAERNLAENYSWFIHVLDESGNIVAQQDRQPQGGYAPTTSWTTNGMRVEDRLFFPGVQGSNLRIGWVNPTGGDLLPVFAPNGDPLPDNFVVLPLD